MTALLVSGAAPVTAQPLRSDVQSLLAYARERNPDLAAMHFEAEVMIEHGPVKRLNWHR